MEQYDILIIGAGAAGIAAAKAAHQAGCRRVLLVDRKSHMGGVLLQCTHRGFGQNQSGPEYTQKLLTDFSPEITWYPNTTVLSVSPDKTALLARTDWEEVAFRQLILATGCLEIPIGALPIAGTRPKGVYTAGQMQEMMNLHHVVPADPVVILGSGDLGLITAGQLAAIGHCVTLVEQRPTCGGMARNQRCLEEYPIQILCRTTISEVFGEKQLEGVMTADGQFLPCKTLLIAAGLQPDRELLATVGTPQWLHVCGNCNRVHPMVEAVVSEGRQAGLAACQNIRGGL